MKTRPTCPQRYDNEIPCTTYDMPQLPATVLIDDIEEVVISLEDVRLGPEYYSYMVTLYPPSHHMG